MLNYIDSLLNRITMYRLVFYFLLILLGVAAIFGAIGIMPYSPVNIIFSTAFLTLVAWVTNGFFARAWKTHANIESVYITAWILALIITPVAPLDAAGIWFLFWAAVLAMASKYILAYGRKHLFNPAAFAVALTALTISQSASWWIGGNIPMLAFVLVGGLLIVRKLQRFDLVIPFFVVAIATAIFTSPVFDPNVTFQKILIHTPLFFFAFIMLTEPLTAPGNRTMRIIYGALVGALFAPAIHLGSIYSTPELALIAGNIFSYAVSPKRKYLLTLKEKHEVGKDIDDFIFSPDAPLKFRPGQYLEWTLSGDRADDRGNRRYFTIASSPTESEVHLGVKFYEKGSTFKTNLAELKPGATILAGQLAGDFTMPDDTSKKLVFIAGGIGITPFRSMVKYIMDTGEPRAVTLLYSNRTVEEITYKDVFEEARRTIGMKTVYAITDQNTISIENAHQGRIDSELIKREVPDYKERMFYISGTHAMVTTFKKTLSDLGVSRTQIRTDFFPGFA